MPDDVGRQPTEPAAELAPEGLAPASRSRTQIGMIAAAVLIAGAVLFGIGNWWLDGRFHQSTDNAYVRADISIIAAKVSGYVRELPVTDNQAIAPGDILLRLVRPCPPSEVHPPGSSP